MIPLNLTSYLVARTSALLKTIVTVAIRRTRAKHQINIADFILPRIESNLLRCLVNIARLAIEDIPLKGEDIRQIRLHVFHQW